MRSWLKQIRINATTITFCRWSLIDSNKGVQQTPLDRLSYYTWPFHCWKNAAIIFCFCYRHCLHHLCSVIMQEACFIVLIDGWYRTKWMALWSIRGCTADLTGRQRLHSAARPTHHQRSILGHRPDTVWNSLPDELRDRSDEPFRQSPKAFLFKQYQYAQRIGGVHDYALLRKSSF